MPKIDTDIFSSELSLFPGYTKGIKPFLKWAGGKTQLLPELIKHAPKTFNKYIEPFIGGGALFFQLNPEKAIIADLNEELILTYKSIRDEVEEVIAILETYKNNEQFYYRVRSFNPNSFNRPERAARLIYLNKICFNGLYRVNKKGEFNVPYGNSNGSFLNKTLLKKASRFLSNTIITLGDYWEVLNKYTEPEDFIFLDPPYFPVGKYSDFKRYTKEFFYKEDHEKLKQEFDRLVDLGCFVILTNSDHPFILELYKDYKIEIIETKRLISSNPQTRTGRDIIVKGGN